MYKLSFFVAGVFGFSALILDAIGSHALQKWLMLPPNEMNIVMHNWQTATRYQLVHALLLIAFGALSMQKRHLRLTLGVFFSVGGLLLFCGGIYIKTVTGNALFGQFTPYGGVCLMLAWLCLCLSPLRFKGR